MSSLHKPSLIHTAKLAHAVAHSLAGTSGAAEAAARIAAKPPRGFDSRSVIALADALYRHAYEMEAR